jgi:hypothetical protein
VPEQNAPTIKTDKGVRFYNPGDRLSEPIPYSIEGADIHTIARYTIDASEGQFFYVPTQIRFLVDNSRIGVDFPTTVCQKFKDRGVVMIDEEWEPSGDEEEDDKVPIARDDEEAKEKGDRIWRKYLFTIVRRWQSQCSEIRVKGGIPDEASGFTKRALKLLGMRDPALSAQDAIQKEQSTSAPAQSTEATDELRKTLELQGQMLQQLLDEKAEREAKDKLKADAAIEKAKKKGAGK